MAEPFILNRALYTDASRSLVLEEGDARAAFVIGGAGSTIYPEDVIRFGLDDSHRLVEPAYEDAVEAFKVESGEEPGLVDTTGEAEADVDLDSLTKAELIALAETRGVEIKSGWTKAEIIAALESE